MVCCAGCHKHFDDAVGLRRHVAHRKDTACSTRFRVPLQLQSSLESLAEVETEVQTNGDDAFVAPGGGERLASLRRRCLPAQPTKGPTLDFIDPNGPAKIQEGQPHEDDLSEAFSELGKPPASIEQFSPPAGQPVSPIGVRSSFQDTVPPWSSKSPYHPFRSRLDWLVGNWIKSESPSQAAANRLLDPEIVAALGLSFKNCYELNNIIDNELPVKSLKWYRTELRLQDTQETAVLWHRNVMEAIQLLYGDPRFSKDMKFAPEKQYIDELKEYRLLSEMWTGNWWWRLQTRLPAGATIIPLILGSDKTLLTQHSGDRYGYPLYLSIGNLPKSIRRSPSQRGTVLLGYLPTNKFEGIGLSEESAKLARHRLFHHCVSHILKDTIPAAKDGVLWRGADGLIRRCYPILGAWMADYPEQCLVTCTRYLRCPLGNINYRHMGMELIGNEALLDDEQYAHPCAIRDQEVTTAALSFTPIQNPFFADLPHAQIHSSMYPDLLHQLLQGLLKTQLLWLADILGKKELDHGFQVLPPTDGARLFEKGITSLVQTSGEEHKDIARVLLGVICSSIQVVERHTDQDGKCVIGGIAALLDFFYTASLETHSERTVVLLRKALLKFHANKEAFVRLGARKRKETDDEEGENLFRIPKLHSLVHYMRAILEGGTLDNWDTQITEGLHKSLAKLPFRESSGRDSTSMQEMAVWVSRHEKVAAFEALLAWKLDVVRQSLATKPTFPALPITEIVDPLQWGCLDFVAALRIFAARRSGETDFHIHQTKADPLRFERVQVWSKCTFKSRARAVQHDESGGLPPVHSSVAHACRARRKGEGRLLYDHPARFDTVIVCDKEGRCRGVEDILVARLKLIFRVPDEGSASLFGRRQAPNPLAYVEWFTRPSKQAVHHASGLHLVHRVRGANGRPIASVIELRAVMRNCMLQPIETQHANTWTSDTVLDLCESFLLNKYLDRDMFTLLV
ncbi:hypothetical protein CALVIDRAFT_487172 [Calocera viscosa TUFC12733]|uniref:C2H2-type domain-containing protein n=1 Tax=Calocera viscosa (strain TUFC12733) TaxID=1330018 RepID=A0A167IJ17_CALVF|nr:hypothetical protein CALVIDRAFT_487172 [Calocera viscosa TUFC12733]